MVAAGACEQQDNGHQKDLVKLDLRVDDLFAGKRDNVAGHRARDDDEGVSIRPRKSCGTAFGAVQVRQDG